MKKLQNIHNILIIQFRPFGDVLLTTSILKTLKTLYPDCSIFFAVFEPYNQIIRFNPYLDKIIVKKKEDSWWKFYRKIASQEYDLILDYQSTNQSALITGFSKAKLKVGLYKKRPRMLFYDIKVRYREKRYAAWMKFDYLKAIGIDQEIREFKAFYPDAAAQFVVDYLEKLSCLQKKKILISPNSPREYKKWKPEYFAEVANHLAQSEEHQVFILRGPGEEAYVRHVLSFIKEKVEVTPPMSIPQLLAWIDRMDLYIGNCGGPKHMAVALGTPSVTVFGPTDPIVWHPHEFSQHIALVNEEKRFADNTFGISPSDVLRAAYQLLQRTDKI